MKRRGADFDVLVAAAGVALALGSLAALVGCGSARRKPVPPHSQATEVLALADAYWAATIALDPRTEELLKEDADARCPALAAAANRPSRLPATDDLLFGVEGVRSMQFAYPPFRLFVIRFEKLHVTAPALKRLLAADQDTLALTKRVLEVHVDLCANLRDLAAHEWSRKRARSIGKGVFESAGFDKDAIRDAQDRSASQQGALRRLGLDLNQAIELTSVNFGLG